MLKSRKWLASRRLKTPGLDLTSKRLSANLRRDDQTQFLGERNEAPHFQNDKDKLVAPPVKDLRDKYVAKLPIELETPLPPPS